jgi:plastocyanin
MPDTLTEPSRNGAGTTGFRSIHHEHDSEVGRTPDGERPGGDRAFREWMMIAVGLVGMLSILAIIISIVALASTNPSRGTTTVVQAGAGGAASAPVAPAVKPESLTIGIKADSEHGKLGPGKQWHDAFLPADFTVHAGATVTITLNNYDSGPHTFTSPSLGVNQIVGGGGTLGAPKTVTFTFKAPSKPGNYQWWCAVPCDPWAMAHDGYMRGHVTVIT